jgi:hypothetical protein
MKCKYMSRGGFICESLIPLLQITLLTATYQKKFFIYQLTHKRSALKRMLKFTLQQLQMFWCNHHHQGVQYSSLLKLWLLK